MEKFSFSGKYSLKITLAYLAVSVIWIIFSDRFITYLIDDPELLLKAQTYKGLFFVIVTAFLLYILIDKSTKTLIENRERLEETLNEKQVLLSELHHRVKNNLAIIASLIELQSDKMEGNGKQALKTTQYRIRTLADIQELLFREENFTKIPFHEHLNLLAGSNELNSEQLTIDELIININQAIPLGLLINEVLSQVRLNNNRSVNSLLQIDCKNEDKVTIIIRFSIIKPRLLNKLTNTNDHLEATLIKTYARQLKGNIDWSQNQEQGTTKCIIKFKVSEHAGSYSAMQNTTNFN